MAHTKDKVRPFAHLVPAWSFQNFIRLAAAFSVAILGIKVGAGYVHLCLAGSRIIEYFAAFGTPMVCAAIVVFVRRYFLAFLAVALVLLVVRLVCQPYLDWVHGPNSPWPGAL